MGWLHSQLVLHQPLIGFTIQSSYPNLPDFPILYVYSYVPCCCQSPPGCKSSVTG